MQLPTIGHYFPLIVGFFAILIGVLAILKPEKMSKKFGIAVSGVALPYVMTTGIRDVFIGLIVLVLFYLQAWNAIGFSHLFIGMVAIADFLIVRKHGDKNASMIHLGGAAVAIAYGLWLLGAQ